MRRFIFFIVFLLYILPATAQYIFDNLKPKDGLSSRTIRSIYRDEEGFVWIGTLNGLNRYDGSHIAAWNHTNTAYPGQLGDVVTCITEFGKDKIWFGTDAGPGMFDKMINKFSLVQVQQAVKENGRTSVTQLQKDRNGRLWMATTKGVYVEKEGIFQPASTIIPYKKLDSLNCFHNAFQYDSIRNCIWLGSHDGMYCIDLNRQQLYSAKHNPEHLPFYSPHLINCLAVDRKGNLWFGDLVTRSLNSYDFTTHKYDTTSSMGDIISFAVAGDFMNALFFDSKDRLWVSTWLYSAYIKIPGGKFEKIPYDKNLPYSIGYGFFNDAMEDNYGNVWLATINGVSRLPAAGFVSNIIKSPSYPYYLDFDFANINTIITDKRGTWWLGKMEGLVMYDTASKTFERFFPEEKELRWNEVFGMEIINGEVWCATGHGIQIFNPATKKFRPFAYFSKEILARRVIRIAWIYHDSEGYVWFPLYWDGMYRFDPRTNECIRYGKEDKRWGDIVANENTGILETSDNKIWLSSNDKGIVIFDKTSRSFTRPLGDILRTDASVAMTEDSRHNIWVSTGNHGIVKADLKGNVLDSVTTRDGIPGTRFYDLNFDASDRLWAISKEALICIDPASKLVTPVRIEVTYSFNDHWTSLVKEGDKLYGTMLDNVVVIDTKKFQQLPMQVPPLISAFYVFQEEMPVTKELPVRLTYQQNFFSIEFSSPFHRESSAVQYAYMLEGFDKDWIYCGRKQVAAYTNVPAGSYTFKIKSTDGSNKWMNKFTSMAIIIKPPFWKTAWFLSVLLVIGVLLLWWLYQVMLKRKQEKRIEDTIDYFANSVYGENSVNEICWDIARNCISQLQFEDCVVYLYDKNTNKLQQKAAYGPKNPKGHEISHPIDIDPGKGIVGTVALSGKPLLIKDTSTDSRYIVDDVRRFSELTVPILHDNEVIGVIDSEHPQKNYFTEEHLKAMITIASISGNKIAEAQAEASAKEKEIKLLEINKMLAESQLMALRAQMNPHFVFNCLNSIQECIVTEKYGEASMYLNKFSKLFRMVLNNSGKDLVTLDEEKEVLQLYLDLEQMRFEKSFSYEMHIDEELETDEILIPSMLLQPYVENALWHGLMHKDGERRLEILFKRLSEEVFQCTIRDNGIGRKRSFELKAQQSKAKRHESKGLKISKDRLDILERQGYHATLTITDRENEQGEATGTMVVIELSTFLKS